MLFKIKFYKFLLYISIFRFLGYYKTIFRFWLCEEYIDDDYGECYSDVFQFFLCIRGKSLRLFINEKTIF